MSVVVITTVLVYSAKQKMNALPYDMLIKKAYRNIGERYVVCFTILHASVGDTR